MLRSYLSLNILLCGVASYAVSDFYVSGRATYSTHWFNKHSVFAHAEVVLMK